MVRICQSITPNQGFDLVNSLIKETDTEYKLIEWKKNYSPANTSSNLSQVRQG